MDFANRPLASFYVFVPVRKVDLMKWCVRFLVAFFLAMPTVVQVGCSSVDQGDTSIPEGAGTEGMTDMSKFNSAAEVKDKPE